MKVLIMSDTHGLTKEIDTIKDRHDCDLIIHCGDSELQSNTKVLKDIEVVKGNCDVGEDFNTEKIIDLNNGVTCLVTLGHLYDVNKVYRNYLIEQTNYQLIFVSSVIHM